MSYLPLIEEALASIQYPDQPAGLYQPIAYTMAPQGKRLRPQLTLMACEACGGKAQDALNAALGIEMFHNFTLLHDDVMDHSDTRRGKPTVHAKWDDNTAILSGDAMLTLATGLMAQAPKDVLQQVLQLFNRTAMQIYEGQQYDVDFERRDNVSIDEYMEMIRLKTSVLLGCACALGALMAGARDERARALYRYGEQLGLAFQMRDDYLDTYGDPALFGKEIGGDIVNEKKTWLWIEASRRAPQALADIQAQKLTDYRKVQAVRDLYDSLGLPAQVQAQIDHFTAAALSALKEASLAPQDELFFADLARSAASRVS